jgi:hypothetical protein
MAALPFFMHGSRFPTKNGYSAQFQAFFCRIRPIIAKNAFRYSQNEG